MTVEIEKLRALCADVPESLTVDYRGDVVVGADGIPAARTGVHPVGSLFPLVLRSPRGDCDSLAVARLAATARPAILALCDRAERADAEIERLRAENARLAGELAALRGTARPAGGPGRCTVCGWPLAESQDKGCVEGDCSYRPRGGA